MQYQTIRVSSCVSVQGELVESLANGDVRVRDGGKVYQGRPVGGDRPFYAVAARSAEATVWSEAL